MGAGIAQRALPRPFLKWAGGKGQLLGELAPLVGEARPFGQYHEPFVGGGALFFEVFRQGLVPEAAALLSDKNDRLMDAYRGVKRDVERVIKLLQTHKEQHSKQHYYAVRAQTPEDSFERAARIIYLNRTCYNGLFRENSQGEFNVPMGRYRNPAICDAENLRAAAHALEKARLETRSFETVLERARPGDFVYFDPPYHPLSRTASFTAYDKSGFGEDDQRRLADVFRELDRRGVKTLLSNSYTDFIRNLYAGFKVEKVYAARPVNSRADRRGKIAEALIRNF